MLFCMSASACPPAPDAPDARRALLAPLLVRRAKREVCALVGSRILQRGEGQPHMLELLEGLIGGHLCSWANRRGSTEGGQQRPIAVDARSRARVARTGGGRAHKAARAMVKTDTPPFRRRRLASSSPPLPCVPRAGCHFVSWNQTPAVALANLAAICNIPPNHLDQGRRWRWG